MDRITGELSEQERNEAAEAVNRTAKLEGDPCPHCGNTDTRVGSNLMRLDVGYDMSLPPIGGGPVHFFSVLPIVCNNCGFIRLFSPYALGVERIAETAPFPSGQV